MDFIDKIKRKFIKKDDKVLSSIKNIKKNDTLTIKLKDGEVASKIIKVGE